MSCLTYKLDKDINFVRLYPPSLLQSRIAGVSCRFSMLLASRFSTHKEHKLPNNFTIIPCNLRSVPASIRSQDRTTQPSSYLARRRSSPASCTEQPLPPPAEAYTWLQTNLLWVSAWYYGVVVNHTEKSSGVKHTLCLLSLFLNT